MSFRSHRRRSSGTGGNSLSRRSSTSQREHDQLAKRRRPLPDWMLVIIIVTTVPTPIGLHSHLVSAKFHHQQSLLRHISEQICSPNPPFLLLLLIQLQLFFLWYLPAKDVQVTTEEGVTFSTRYTSFESSVLICLLYVFGALLGLYPGHLVFSHWVGLLCWLSVLSLLVPLLLLRFLPSASASSSPSPPSPSFDDSSSYSFAVDPPPPLPPLSNPSPISQLFYGRHLQPVLLDVDLKAFLTVRLALTLWLLFLISALFAHRHLFPSTGPSASLTTTLALQLVYVFRRQWFEQLLSAGLDNKNDRAGFYRIYAVLVLLPTVYLIPITIGATTNEFPRRSAFLFAGLFLFGLICQYLNTAMDLQRYKFRQSHGDMKIEGKDPFYVCVRYRNECGDSRTSLLLGSGYWGMARHPNYTAEFGSFLAWTLTWTQPIVYAPIVLLAIVLWIRMRKNELRCQLLYGQFWTQYCAKVPYRLFPGF